MSMPRLVGVVHLPALPGAPGAFHQHPAEALQHAGQLAVKEALLLAQAGFDGVVLENFGDTPFYKTQAPPETVASLSIIAAAVREAVDLQIGINVLRNDGRSALAIASVTGCDFIRVNILSGVAATDQGIIEGDASFLLRERDRLHSAVSILADVHVKHSVTLSSFDIGFAVEEVGLRALADGVIVTGAGTGYLIEPHVLEHASRAARRHKIPIYIGSGATHENLPEIRPWVDGMIVGSCLRKNGKAGAPMDKKRAQEFVRLFSHSKKLKSSHK